MNPTCQQSVEEKSYKLLKLIENGSDLSFKDMSNILAELRIFTREKSFSLQILDKCTSLLVPLVNDGHVEAQKCLSNLIMNYDSVRDKLVEPYVSSIKSRLKMVIEHEPVAQTNIFQSIEHKQQLLYHDLRLIFLLTAMCTNSRDEISNRLSSLIIRFLDSEADYSKRSCPDYELMNEGLKVLFNMTLKSHIDHKLIRGMFRKLLDMPNWSEDKLFVNIIHLLTNMPEEVFTELSEEDKDRILNHLRVQLASSQKQELRDHVLPVLNVCLSICKYSNETRKRWFVEILQSTQDFELRPEEYKDFRGNLVKLMTSVDVHIKDMAADFLHLLCNGDTEKFIIYTGFGNSAAYLSSRGLLSKSSNNSNGSTEDSDYQDLRDKLNPITGKLETIKKNPMEEMTEEEKEYHAEELANAITKLSNLGLIKPISINNDKTLSDIHPNSLDRS